MSLYVTVPISTEVIESNPDCAFRAAYEEGVLMITVDTRGQHVHQRLGLSTKTRLHGGQENRFGAQELSAMAWPKLTGTDAGRLLSGWHRRVVALCRGSRVVGVGQGYGSLHRGTSRRSPPPAAKQWPI